MDELTNGDTYIDFDFEGAMIAFKYGPNIWPGPHWTLNNLFKEQR